MTFFVIQGSEDGTQMSEIETSDDLKEFISETGITEFKSEYSDTNYWSETAALIINGEIVVPKPKKVVKEWDV